MKKVLSLLLVFAMILPFAACGKKVKDATTAVTTEQLGPDVTIYGDGVSPTLILSSSISSTARDTVLAIRGTLKTRLGATPKMGSTSNTEKEGVEIVFGDTTREISERAKAYLPALDGDEATYVIYFNEDGAAIVWNHSYGAEIGVKFFSDNYMTQEVLKIPSGTKYIGHFSISEYEEELRLAAEEKARIEEEERQARIERNYAARFNVISDPTVRAAVKDFYETFYDPEAIIRWWAGLYDPEIGGFYYANSARDNAGYGTNLFLPDMESTWQIINRLRQFDSDLARYLGPEITAKIIEFYQTKQDPDDGYFYHPQWGKSGDGDLMSLMRRTRDQDWAIAALENLHSAPLYPTALDRARNSAETVDVTVQRLASYAGLSKTAATPRTSASWQANESSVRSYVNNLMNTQSCEAWANELDTQISTFEAKGVIRYVLDVLDERVNPEYGLWVSGYDANRDLYYNLKSSPTTEVPYGIFTNTYKVMKVYNAGGRLFKYAEKMVENTIKAINSKDPGARITYIFNPWATLGNVRSNLADYGTSAQLATYNRQISENIIEMINSLKSSLGIYKHADGSYSYLPSGCSSPTIYGTPVSLGLNEGDVNAHNLVMSFSMHICNTIGVDTIAIFNENHAKLMQELLQNAPTIPKKGDPSQLQEDPGVTYDFSADTLGSMPRGATQTSSDDSAVQNGTTFKVVQEPGNTSNKVVEINKNTEENINGRQLYFPLLSVDGMTDTTVLEFGMRLNVTGGTRYGNSISGSNPNIMQIGFLSQSDLFWMPTLQFNNGGYILLTQNSTSGGATIEYPDNRAKTFAFDTWYEFTFRLTIKNYGKSNAEFKVEILVDGQPFGTSTNFYSSSIAFRTGKTVRVRFQPQMRIHALILVDDVTMTIKK